MVDTSGDVMRWARSRVGTVVKGKYRLDDVLGAGGMAVVFRATHRNQAEFALKMLLPELSFRQDLVKRFLREGYAANSVKHPGVVQVVDDDVDDHGAAFLVMELLHGKPVESLWLERERRLPLRVVSGIVDQLLDVLTAAHPKGIIHRDLKPANLFLTSDGTVKVLDFGIARVKDALSSGAGGTHTGMVLGTPAFMAPEQAKAQAHAIDAQTDLWAVGATFFTLATGRFVHEGENAPQLLINTATTAARPIASVASEMPPALAAVVDRSLAFEKADRWPSAEAMRAALREACRETYGATPARDTLAAALTPSSTASPTRSTQRTVPLAVTPSPRATAGGTTAQPVSRHPTSPSAVPLRSRAPLAFALGGAAILLGTIAAAVLVGHHDVPTAPAAQPDPPPAMASRLPPGAATSSERPAASAPPTVVVATPAPLAVSITPVSTHAPATASKTHAPVVASATATPAKPPASCDPPYYFDPQGRKIFKKECLR